MTAPRSHGHRRSLHRTPARPIPALLAGALVLGLLAACSDGGPTAPAASMDMQLTGAAVMVGGQPVGGLTIPPGRGTSTRFEARFSTDGAAIGPLDARVRFTRPMGMGMMGGAGGTFPLYDDGTHGDHVAGDHVHSYEDHDGEYGMHMSEAAMGAYHYDFYGRDDHGHESAHMTLVVTVAR